MESTRDQSPKPVGLGLSDLSMPAAETCGVQRGSIGLFQRFECPGVNNGEHGLSVDVNAGTGR